MRYLWAPQQAPGWTEPTHRAPRAHSDTSVDESSRGRWQSGAPLTTAMCLDGMERALATYGEDVAKATAVQGFQHISREWNLTSHEAAGLLNLPATTWESGGWIAAIGREQILRAILLIGIYRALHQCFGEHLANSWVHRQNSYPLFGGQTPAQIMVLGGVPAMKATLEYVDGMRGRT